VQLFHSQQINEGKILLDETESRHAISVLRKQLGDVLQVIDGKGTCYEAEIIEANKKRALLEIRGQTDYPKSDKALHLVVAPTKNIDRIEWILEKSIEIGLASIHFIQCERSERKNIKMDRLEKIALAACKQSFTWHFPEINAMKPFKNFLDETREGNRFIAVCDGAEILLKTTTPIQNEVWVMIGPEGDFSPGEYAEARAAGWRGISLGEKRLRTETAALLAVAEINFIWQA